MPSTRTISLHFGSTSEDFYRFSDGAQGIVIERCGYPQALQPDEVEEVIKFLQRSQEKRGY